MKQGKTTQKLTARLLFSFFLQHPLSKLVIQTVCKRHVKQRKQIMCDHQMMQSVR